MDKEHPRSYPAPSSEATELPSPGEYERLDVLANVVSNYFQRMLPGEDGVINFEEVISIPSTSTAPPPWTYVVPRDSLRMPEFRFPDNHQSQLQATIEQSTSISNEGDLLIGCQSVSPTTIEQISQSDEKNSDIADQSKPLPSVITVATVHESSLPVQAHSEKGRRKKNPQPKRFADLGFKDIQVFPDDPADYCRPAATTNKLQLRRSATSEKDHPVTGQSQPVRAKFRPSLSVPIKVKRKPGRPKKAGRPKHSTPRKSFNEDIVQVSPDDTDDPDYVPPAKTMRRSEYEKDPDYVPAAKTMRRSAQYEKDHPVAGQSQPVRAKFRPSLSVPINVKRKPGRPKKAGHPKRSTPRKSKNPLLQDQPVTGQFEPLINTIIEPSSSAVAINVKRKPGRPKKAGRPKSPPQPKENSESADQSQQRMAIAEQILPSDENLYLKVKRKLGRSSIICHPKHLSTPQIKENPEIAGQSQPSSVTESSSLPYNEDHQDFADQPQPVFSNEQSLSVPVEVDRKQDLSKKIRHKHLPSPGIEMEHVESYFQEHPAIAGQSQLSAVTESSSLSYNEFQEITDPCQQPPATNEQSPSPPDEMDEIQVLRGFRQPHSLPHQEVKEYEVGTDQVRLPIKIEQSTSSSNEDEERFRGFETLEGTSMTSAPARQKPYEFIDLTQDNLCDTSPRVSMTFCPICGIKDTDFSKLYLFQLHLDWHMQQLYPFKCSRCMEYFAHFDELLKHNREKHEQPFAFMPAVDLSHQEVSGLLRSLLQVNHSTPQPAMMQQYNEAGLVYGMPIVYVDTATRNEKSAHDVIGTADDLVLLGPLQKIKIHQCRPDC